MKKFAKVLLGLVVVAGVAVSAALYLTADLANTADAFFQSVKQKDIAQARSHLSEDFKASTDEGALAAFLSKGAILNFKQASWSQRSVSGSRGELSGEITTDSGGVVPIKLMLVKENAAWKIYAIQKPGAGLLGDSAAPGLPDAAAQLVLTRQSVRVFAAGVNGKDLAGFHKSVSQLWQKQISVAQMNQAFAPFIDAALDLTPLEQIEPLIDSPVPADADGVIVIAGRYPTSPKQVYFEQKFVQEGTAWKLIGFNVSIKE